MLAKIKTSSLQGVNAQSVSVEIFTRSGQLPGFMVVGLPDPVVRESKERIFAALNHYGCKIPPVKITINLAPANIRKEGSFFDLPIAVGLLATLGIVQKNCFPDTLILGELSLDGHLRPVRGVLPIAAEAYKKGIRRIIVPKPNAVEAAAVQELDVYGFETMAEVIAFLNGEQTFEPCQPRSFEESEAIAVAGLDFMDVKGQEHAKRAIEVAAAGGHNLIMIGSPGSGKTMLARRMPTILPALSFEESLEISKLHSVSGLILSNNGLLRQRPFRAPHHSVTNAGLIGGGSYPLPGEVSLAHHGVLFLDEMPEFKRSALEVLRQPLEDGQVSLTRANMTVTYPSRIMLVGAMNPCPCGYYSHPEKLCTCRDDQIQRYFSRISGPLMDRIDIHVEVTPVKFQELQDRRRGESSLVIRSRVEEARELQRKRYQTASVQQKSVRPDRTYCNAHMSSAEIRQYCHLDADSCRLMEHAMKRLGLSARAYDRILKVSRTIADLDHKEQIESIHISEAIQYRALDRTHRVPAYAS